MSSRREGVHQPYFYVFSHDQRILGRDVGHLSPVVSHFNLEDMCVLFSSRM